MSQDIEQDAALIQDYVTECDELMQRLDQDLVALETSPADADLLNRIFRAFHTIKGTSGFLGFTQVAEITHIAEDVLNLLRQGRAQVTRHTMDVLLATLDQMRQMIADIRGGVSRSYALEGLLADLKGLLAPAANGSPAGPAAAPSAPPAPAASAAAETSKPAAGGEPEPVAGVIPPIGEILVEAGKATPLNVFHAAEKQAEGDPRRLGEILVEQGAVKPADVLNALKTQEKAGGAQKAHAAEGRTIRVDVAKLDELVNLVGELVLERNRLVHLSKRFSGNQVSSEQFESAFVQSTARLGFITDELQTAGLRTRMVSVDTVFRRFPRMVRDLAAALGKQVELVIRGEDTELDKTIVEEISDPLVHLLRNSLDHGIESPAARQAAGKHPKGTVRVEARQEGDNIVIEIADDGAGMDPARLSKKALEKGLYTQEQLAAMNRREILDLIFLPGFSTAEKVSGVSGRGVGMDVVRSNMKKLNGTVELESEPGHGSCVRLRLPLTLAIVPVLLVSITRETYALPLRSIVETVRVRAAEIHSANGTDMLRLRDRMVPVCWLHRALAAAAGSRQDSDLLRVVILAAGERRIGVVVDRLLGQEETVIKPLSTHLRNVPGLSGATISGDGEVRLMLDPGGLLGVVESRAGGPQ
jgi:two-component system chemotaxis sensor kinase CheA